MKDEPSYNPLDKRNLGDSVAEALLARAMSTLPPNEAFLGAGIDVLYYCGEFPAYREIPAERSGIRPLYVGKAVPKGSRKGAFALDASPGSVLYDRLVEHAESIRQVENLDLRDFRCRFLVVDDIFIKLAESLLIRRFLPLWNQVLEGFGNHDPGRGRYRQRRSLWDTLHPGRKWALKCQPNRRSPEWILLRIRLFLESSRRDP